MKKTLIMTTLITFMSSANIVEAADCSNYKTFSHKWNMCKVGQLPANDSAEGETSEQKVSTKKGFWHKIRTFGGETRSED